MKLRFKHQAKREDQIAALPDTLQPYAEPIFTLIDSINRKAVYTVHFDSDELVAKAVP